MWSKVLSPRPWYKYLETVFLHQKRTRYEKNRIHTLQIHHDSTHSHVLTLNVQNNVRAIYTIHSARAKLYTLHVLNNTFYILRSANYTWSRDIHIRKNMHPSLASDILIILIHVIVNKFIYIVGLFNCFNTIYFIFIAPNASQAMACVLCS